MNKFDLAPSLKKRSDEIIVPEIISDSPTTNKMSTKKPKSIDWGNHINTSLELAKIIVQGEVEIGKIRAITAQEVERIDSEIKKIIAINQEEIKKVKEMDSSWHSKFDKKESIINNRLKLLESHPEWSDEVKMKIIDLAITQIEQS